MLSNFEFLKKDFPVLANFGELAEKYLYSDSNSCLMKLGMIGETIGNMMFAYDNIPFPVDNTAAKRIDVLYREGLLSKVLVDVLHALMKMPYDLLLNKDGLNLREYQLNAVKAAERAIIEGKSNVLLAMATGTGKTRTVLGMIYRFLKSGRFKRILFLVDRNSLGEQALDVFKEVRLEVLMTLNNIYNVKGLEDKSIDSETRLQIATVQSMVKRIMYNEDEEKTPSISDYDLLIIDEAHRGYILDKEMGEEESLFNDQRDYQSKYRAVIEYFDADSKFSSNGGFARINKAFNNRLKDLIEELNEYLYEVA